MNCKNHVICKNDVITLGLCVITLYLFGTLNQTKRQNVRHVRKFCWLSWLIGSLFSFFITDWTTQLAAWCLGTSLDCVRFRFPLQAAPRFVSMHKDSISCYTNFSVLLDKVQFSWRNCCSRCRNVSVTATSFFNAGWKQKVDKIKMWQGLMLLEQNPEAQLVLCHKNRIPVKKMSNLNCTRQKRLTQSFDFPREWFQKAIFIPQAYIPSTT